MTTIPQQLSLGITGSIGSGKTLVGDIFAELGHPLFDADLAVHRLLSPGNEGYQQVVKKFGQQFVQNDDTINRSALGKHVFADPSARRDLEAILHPLVRHQEIEFLTNHQQGLFPVLVIPLLFETNAEKLFSHTAVVTVSHTTRLERLKNRRDQLSPEQIEQRLAAQMSQEEKVNRADFVIDNNGTPEATKKQVLQLIEKLTKPTH
jgi:dephospho-CoA kinase